MSTKMRRTTLKPIAILAPAYPVLSETFVRSDVDGLRARGWKVFAVGVRSAPSMDGALADHVVLSGAWWLHGLGEAIAHPLRTLHTLAMAALDCARPGEPLSPRGRAKLLGQAAAALPLAAWLRRRGVRHVHCHFAHTPTGMGMYAAKHLRVSFSFAGHANDIFERRSLLRSKLKRASFVACISKWHADWFASQEPTATTRLVRCGVDVDVARSLSSTTDALRIASVARLVEKKGIDTLLVAMQAVQERLATPVSLEVIGDGPELVPLQRASIALGIANRVNWMGAKPPREVWRLLQRSHVFALPCRVAATGDRDGIPVALMEAMAAGLPVVAGDLPAIRELVHDGVTGLLVPGGDDASLASALMKLANSPQLQAELGRQARAWVEAEFSREVNLSRLESALREALGEESTDDQDARLPAQ